MARVLHVIETLGLGGAERLLALTVRELKRSTHTSVVAHVLDRPRDWREQIENDGTPVESLMLASPWALPQTVAGVRRLIRRWRVDLVHSHLYFPNLAAQVAGWREGVPVVSSLHNLELEPEILQDNLRFTRRKQWALQQVARIGVRVGRPTLIAVSEAVRQSALRQLGAAPEAIVTIHSGIDVDAFVPPAANPSLRDRLGLSSSSLVLVIVGRLVPLKGHRYLIEALPALRAMVPDATVLVVGDGVQRQPLAALATSLGVANAVRFLGAGRDLVDHALAAADIVVAPSLSEGFGLAVLEAMATSRPCVASRTGGLPEIVEHEGSGLLVPPADAGALAAALLRLARDPALRQRMGRRARAIVEERFDIRETARRLAALYDEILAGRAGRKG
jgi:glycosyltransferase involved in cell wall biosynthesis